MICEAKAKYVVLQYFSLLSHLLEVYPETVAQLNTDAFTHVLGTLDFGLHHQVHNYPFINRNVAIGSTTQDV